MRFIQYNIRRSISLFLTIVLGTVVFYFILNAASGLEEKILRMSQGNVAHINITSLFQDDENYKALKDELYAIDDQIIDINLANNFSLETRTKAVYAVKAIDLNNKVDVFQFNKIIKENRLNKEPASQIGFDDYDFEILIAASSAMSVSKTRNPDDALGRIIFLRIPGTETFYRFKITGILYTDVVPINSRFIYLKPEVSHYLMGQEIYNTIEITLKNSLKSTSLIEKVEQILLKHNIEGTVVDWQTNNEMVANVIYVERVSLVLIQLLTVLAVAFTMSNLLILNANEKRSQIGILKAMGYTNKQVRNLFLLETIIFTVSGLLVGLLVGNSISTIFMRNFKTSIGMPLIALRTTFFNKFSIITIATLLSFNLIGSIFSLKQVKNLKVIDVIKDK